MTIAPGRFFLPGPTEVHPDVLQAQAKQPIGHRSPAMTELMDCVQPGLQEVFRTSRPVVVSTSSATALMEGAVRCGVSRKLLCLVNGAFSQRFADLAEANGIPHEVLAVPWGEVLDPGAVADRMAAGDFDAVTMVHSETSTGALNDVPALVKAIRQQSDVLVIVDSVTGIGGAPFHTDEWGVDLVVTGSQKAMALPPGLAFAVASEAFLDRARGIGRRGWYLDFVEFYDRLEKSQTPTTPAITLLYALAVQLARMAEETLEARWSRHAELSRMACDWVDELRSRTGTELHVLPPAGARSPTVTCVRVPQGVSGPAVVRGALDRGWVIGGGYGKLKAGTFRIGHMGDHPPAALESLLDVLEEVIRQEASA